VASIIGSDRFVRVPTALLEALLHAPLSGGQYRVLLWALRHTYGWNRPSTPFTWYRIAQDLGLNRATAFRAGQVLLKAGILKLHDTQLSIEANSALWDRDIVNAPCVAGRQLWIPGMSVTGAQRQPLLGDNAGVAGTQPKRCPDATLFRRAKDSSKDRLKTYLKTGPHKECDLRHRLSATANIKRRHLAGAAEPIPGKYDRLSQN
jgi:phage replication O-like protein O